MKVFAAVQVINSEILTHFLIFQATGKQDYEKNLPARSAQAVAGCYLFRS